MCCASHSGLNCCAFGSNLTRLDGVVDFCTVLKNGYGLTPHEPLSSPSYKQIIWARAAAPLHVALILINTLARQIVRSLSSLLTLKFDIALRDLSGCIFQLILLPYLGLVAIYSPQKALDTCTTTLQSRVVEYENCNGTYYEESTYSWQPYVLTVIRALFVLPLGVIDGCTRSLSWALTGSWSQLSADEKAPPYTLLYSFVICVHIPWNVLNPTLKPSVLESTNLMIYRTQFN